MNGNNMSIYQISELINSFEFEVDEDTGEIKNFDSWESLQMAREEKIEATALVYKQAIAMEAAVKDEIKALQERMKAFHNRGESCKRYLDYALNGAKFETSKCKVGYRKNPPALVVTDQGKFNAWFEKADDKFAKIKTTREPDKTAIKEAIANGEKIDGAEVQQAVSLTVK